MLNVLKQIGKSICYVGVYFGLQLVIYDATMSMTTPTIVFAGVLALLILWWSFKIRKKKFMEETRLKLFDVKFWPAILLGSVGLCLFVNFGMQLLPIPEDVLTEYAEASESLMEGPFFMLFLSNVVMAPLIEEILFRGLVFTRLQRAMPVWAALFLSSVFFGLMHGQILWVCYTTLVGMMLCFVAWKTDSTLAPMFMHFVFNLFGTCMGYFVEAVSGMTSLILTVGGILCLAVTIGLLCKKQRKHS